MRDINQSTCEKGSILTVNNKMALIDAVTTSPLVKSFIAGSFSGTCSTILFQPLDLVKTRIQTAISLGPGSGMIATVGDVVKSEKIYGLWKGMTPSMLRCVPGVGLYFSSLHWLKGNISDGHPGPLEAVFIGVFARTITGVTMIPMTVVKTRCESGVYSYGGVWDAVKVIYTKEGARGLTCGLIPTLLRDAPFSGLYLMFYTQTKKAIPQEYIEGSRAPLLNFGCGIISGLMASVITQPFDVIKTKMQLYPERFDGVVHAIIFVYKKYGVKGYFKGLAPRMLRRTLMAAMAWTVYEQMMTNLGIK